jgi:hydrogenase assembly chaperone HypC/HupF
MCLTVPYQVVSVKKGKIGLTFNKQRRTANSSLVKVKKGDYVLLQQGIIVKKLNKKEAQNFFALLVE